MNTYEPEGVCLNCGKPLRRDCSTVYINADGTRRVHEAFGGEICNPQNPESLRAEPGGEDRRSWKGLRAQMVEEGAFGPDNVLPGSPE